MVAVLAANLELVEALRHARSAAARWVRDTLVALLTETDFAAALPGMMLPDDASQERAGELVRRLLELTAPGS